MFMTAVVSVDCLNTVVSVACFRTSVRRKPSQRFYIYTVTINKTPKKINKFLLLQHPRARMHASTHISS